MQIFHLALAEEWEAARRTGAYTTSTLGRTLAEEGFIHASRADQWQGVRDRFYADVTQPLVLLVIDTERLTAPVVEEVPDGADQAFPHIYGILDPSAVVRAIPLDGHEASSHPGQSFSRIFFTEMVRNALLVLLVMAAVAVGTLIGKAVDDDWGVLVGTGAGLAVGVWLAVVISRRSRPPRPRNPS